MNMYFIACDYPDGDLDWFVVAQNPQQAIDLWKDDVFVRDFYDDSLNVRVFLVPQLGPVKVMYTEPKVLSWHEDVEQVAP